MDALVVVFDKTHKLSEIIHKEICQASPEMKYNDTNIEYSKSKECWSVKAFLQHTISVLFVSCKNDDTIDLEVIIDTALFQKPSPKYVFSTMIASLDTKRTILTSKFSVWDVEEFHNAYKTEENKEYFLKTYATASREKT